MDQDVAAAQPSYEAALTIGGLAERSGVNVALLRVWESRYSFPKPTRLPSGHRRYTEADVERVREVMRRKESGLRLEAAIAAAVDSSPPQSPSIFAELRRRHPALGVVRLSKSTLIAMSRAIEDECCAKAASPILFGAFQRGDRYEPSAARWVELARVARSAIVFADVWAGTASEADGPIRASLLENAPMRREWAVICDAMDANACLSAWELPGQTDTPDRDRLFEAVWSVDPAVVRDASRVAASAAASAGIPSARRLMAELALQPAGPSSSADANGLFNRLLWYVDGSR